MISCSRTVSDSYWRLSEENKKPLVVLTSRRGSSKLARCTDYLTYCFERSRADQDRKTKSTGYCKPLPGEEAEVSLLSPRRDARCKLRPLPSMACVQYYICGGIIPYSGLVSSGAMGMAADHREDAILEVVCIISSRLCALPLSRSMPIRWLFQVVINIVDLHYPGENAPGCLAAL